MDSSGKNLVSSGYSSTDQDKQPSTPEIAYGWGKFRPSCLKFLNNPKCFLLVIMFYSFCGGVAMIGFPILTLPTIEKRFGLSSKEIGFLAAANDIAAPIFVLFIGFYGDYGNKIKWVGGGGAVAGFGLLLSTLPHFMIGRYDVPDFQTGQTGMCLLSTNSSLSGLCDVKNAGTNWYYMLIFALGQFILGAGVCPMYSLMPAYLDENVEPKHMPVYVGLFYLSLLLGPGLGVFINGLFLGVYVDIEQPPGLNLTPKDPRWIGAWWLGFLVFACLFLIMTIVMLGFPRSLPGAKERREKHIQEGNIKMRSGREKYNLKDIFPQLKSLILNKVFLLNSLGLAVSVTFTNGLLPFMGKLLKLKFGVDVVKSGYLLSSTLLPSVLVGILGGSFVTRLFPVKSMAKKSALFGAVCRTLVIIIPFAMLLPGCTDVNMAGVSLPYTDRIQSSREYIMTKNSDDSLLSKCNLNCSCNTNKFSPVCGSDKIVYLNPCYAGCTVKYDNKTLGGCSCISGDGSSQPGTARQGYCDRDCKNLVVFLFMFGFGMFVAYSAFIPFQTVVLRCVPDDKRAFAVGLQYILLKTIGVVVGPLVMGHLLDVSCDLWQVICEEKGRCLIYDIDLVDRNLCITGVICLGFSAVFYIFSWFLHPSDVGTTTAVPSEKEQDEITTFL